MSDAPCVMPLCILCAGPCPYRFTVDGYAVHRCAKCDLEFVHPTPEPEAIASVYAQDYFEGGSYVDYFNVERDLSQRKARTRLDTLAALGANTGTLLDFGCAAGYFVDEAVRRGFDAYGVEPSEQARAHAPATVASRLAARLDEGFAARFDVITLWDVLEHLTDPIATLDTIRTHLNPRGWLAIVVPAIGNVNTRIAPTTWDQYKPPEHLWFWSLRSLTALLERYSFDVVSHDVAWARYARWISLDGSDHHQLIRALRKLDAGLHRTFTAVGMKSLVTDSIAIYARSRI